jgi:prevent-host-death family protein
MKTVSFNEAKNTLSEQLNEVASTHEEILITRHGHPAGVLVSPDVLSELRETIEWLSKPGIREDVRQAEGEYEAGATVRGDALRAEFGLPTR